MQHFDRVWDYTLASELFVHSYWCPALSPCLCLPNSPLGQVRLYLGNANALRHPSKCLDNWMKRWALDWRGIWQGGIWQEWGRLTWVASGQCSPNVLWAKASSLIIGDLWSFTMAPAAQNTSFHPRLIIIGRPTILHKSASCPWEFAPKVSLECSCLNFSSNRIKVKSQDGKAEHRGSLKGA